MLTITSTEFTNPNVQQTLKNPPTSLIKDLRKAYTGPLVCRLKKKRPRRGTLEGPNYVWEFPGRALWQFCLNPLNFSVVRKQESHPVCSLPPRHCAACVKWPIKGVSARKPHPEPPGRIHLTNLPLPSSTKGPKVHPKHSEFAVHKHQNIQEKS